VLRVMRRTGAVFVDIDASASWSDRTPEAKTVVPRVMPDAQQRISYHLIRDGAYWGRLCGCRDRRWLRDGIQQNLQLAVGGITWRVVTPARR
jgi:hypothetical protein